MAQRYTSVEALERMSKGLCPECGLKPDEHDSDPRFWVRIYGACDLIPLGVLDRIAQYEEDRKAS